MISHFFNPLYSTTCKHLRLLVTALLCAVSSALFAADPAAFSADYHVYRYDSHVANSKITLQKQNRQWVWTMNTEPRGFYRWLTDKRPFEEAHLNETDAGLALAQLYKGDNPKDPAEQSTWFDPLNKLIYYSDGKQNKQLTLEPDISSYLSIHLLYDDMKQQGLGEKTVRFFKDGELINTHLTLQTNLQIDRDGKKISVDKLTQHNQDSDKTMIYYYAKHPLAPIKIEQAKKGEVVNSMWRTALQ